MYATNQWQSCYKKEKKILRHSQNFKLNNFTKIERELTLWEAAKPNLVTPASVVLVKLAETLLSTYFNGIFAK